MPELTKEQAELQEKLKNMSPEEIAEFQKQNCVFCHIVSGKVNAKKIYEDDKILVILDINPASKAHMLVMPKEHYAIMPIVPEEILSHMIKISKKLSASAKLRLKSKGSTIFIANGGIAGQRSQHFMLHIIPRYEADGLKMFKLTDNNISEKDFLDAKTKLSSRIGYKEEKSDKENIEKEKLPQKKEIPKEDKKEPEKKSPNNNNKIKEEKIKEKKESKKDNSDKDTEIKENMEKGEGMDLDSIAELLS